MESRQCTPSVFARLMGLDELSPHQPVQKKQKVLSENYLRRVASIGVRGKHSSCEQHSFGLSDAEQNELKDAFEIHGKTKREDCNRRVQKGKSEFSFSTVDEVHNADAVADSKIDLFMKYLQEPEHFITKHPHDLQGIPHHLQSGFLTVLKSSNASDAGKTDRCCIFGSKTDQESAKLLWNLGTGLVTDSHGEHVLGNGFKFFRSQKESINLPTKIVILKSKLGEKESGTRCFLSSNFSRDSHSINKKYKEFVSPERGNLCIEEEKGNYVAKDVEPVRSRLKILREISGQTGLGKNNLFTEVAKAGSRDNDSFAEDSKWKTFSSPISFDWKNHLDESCVGREARKDNLKRWKTTKKFQEVEVASRNRTLGKMLAIPVHETSPHNSDFRVHEHGQSSQTGLHCNLFMRAPEKRVQHRFRKQRHNQKDGSEYRNSVSSCMKSQSASCFQSRNSHSVQDDCVLQGDLKRKLEEKDTCGQEYMVFKSSSSCCSCLYSTIKVGRGVQEQQKKLEEKDLSEQSTVAAMSSVNCFAAASMIADTATDAETVVEGQSSENHKEQHMEMTNGMLLMEDDFSSQVPDAPTPQDTPIGIFNEDSFSSFGSYMDPDSLVNLEETYQSSPNSVLEPLFEKGNSSSFGCCQVVHSNLHGLQLQLKLLKSESSEECSEGDGMIVSSDDDSEEGFVSHSGENEEVMKIFNVEDSRDFSYVVDVFTEAGFHGRNSGMSYETWHSLECPISPTVFGMLEKKYGEQMSWERSERRLLFDCINSELMEILKPSIGVHGTKPLSTRLLFGKNPEMIEEELWMLLVHHQKQANKYSSVKVLGKDDKWLELGDDIEVTVREIENSLIDQLAEEVFSLESF